MTVGIYTTHHVVTLGHTVSELAEPQGLRHVHEDDVVETARAERHGQRRLAQVYGVHLTTNYYTLHTLRVEYE